MVNLSSIFTVFFTFFKNVYLLVIYVSVKLSLHQQRHMYMFLNNIYSCLFYIQMKTLYKAMELSSKNVTLPQ